MNCVVCAVLGAPDNRETARGRAVLHRREKSMTKAQVGKFFKLARAAWKNAAPEQAFESWRKAMMMQVVGVDSVFGVDATWGYDALMGHMAVLACDYSACAYFAASEERRVRWVLEGMRRDLEFLNMSGVPESYLASIYAQAGMQPTDFADATLRDLLLIIPMLDTHIRRIARENNLEIGSLPTAGAPWYFRGSRAAALRNYLDAVAASNLREAQQREVVPA